MVECIIDTMNQTEFQISVVSSDSGFWWWNSGLKKSKNVSLQDSDDERLTVYALVPYEWCDTI